MVLVIAIERVVRAIATVAGVGAGLPPSGAAPNQLANQLPIHEANQATAQAPLIVGLPRVPSLATVAVTRGVLVLTGL